MINLRFANGAIGNIDLCRNTVHGYDICTEVLGSVRSLLIGKLHQTAIGIAAPRTLDENRPVLVSEA